MIATLTFIWVLIGIITGGAILLSMAICVISLVFAMIAGIIKGVKK